MLLRILLVVVLTLGLSGCLQPLESDRSRCETQTVAPDGTVIPPGEPYWTLTTDQVPIPDAEARVDQIPGVSVSVDGERVETALRGAKVDGNDWIDRMWTCHLAPLPVIEVQQGSRFLVVADSEEGNTIRLGFIYNFPNGIEPGTSFDPEWQAEGPILDETLPEIRAGRHDAMLSVTYADGSSREHQFKVEFQAYE